jgi:hypothetical protein
MSNSNVLDYLLIGGGLAAATAADPAFDLESLVIPRR